MKELKDPKQIFSKISFDKKKKINRCDAIVPIETLEKIKRGITTEELAEIPYPVFRYYSQITIHGRFPDVDDFDLRFGGRKMLVQNQNKSIGVKFGAIDLEKKQKIAHYVKHKKGWSCTRNDDLEIIKMRRIKKDDLEYWKGWLREQCQSYDVSPYVWGGISANIGVIPMLGLYAVFEIVISAIPEKHVNTVIELICDDSIENMDSEIARIEEQRREEKEQRRKERERNREKERREYDEVLKPHLDDMFERMCEEPYEDFIAFYHDKQTQSYRIIKKVNGKIRFMDQREYLTFDWEINRRRRKNIMEPKTLKRSIGIQDIYLYKVHKDEPKDKPVHNGDIEVIDYSGKSIAVRGNTKPIKDKLKSLGGRFNPRLTDPQTGERFVGWVFPKSKKESLLEIKD